MFKGTTNSLSSIFVVGGAGGVGFAIVDRLLSAGSHVTVLDRSLERCNHMANRYSSFGSQINILNGNGADPILVQNTLEQMAENKHPVTALVHTAGSFASTRNIRSISCDDWKNVINDNLTSAFVSSQTVLRWLCPQKNGRIIFVSSIVALHLGSSIDDIAYTASKAAILGMVKSLARSLGKLGITVNAVAPGLIETPLTEGLMSPETGGTIQANWNRMCPLGRMGKADDVAAAILFLLSEEANFLNGIVLPVDGGFHC